uniref:Uncharacterized protein n=1 Tax=Anguilla anguilla TaxID=7936 RepID=A0A0E9RKE6_ANGAN
MAGMPSCEVTPWRGSMPHTYTATESLPLFLQKYHTYHRLSDLKNIHFCAF